MIMIIIPTPTVKVVQEERSEVIRRDAKASKLKKTEVIVGSRVGVH